ncbi:twin-arginine translocation signal domain-containing protein, partial [Klebsiella variicola]|uniref:twin-arginine translocation signal domain-containing protein n=1 Tax=Klebsiella variicola TaxID=244366 RepID=UPI001D124EAA
MSISRRHLLQTSAVLAAAPLVKLTGGGAYAQAAEGSIQWRHALSLFGEIKYAPGFAHFDYVNPAAPKGGVARQISIGTFDNFNIAVA